jgi:GNAT superfamily N-acetyltransferase
MIELFELKTGEPCGDVEINQRVSSSPKAKFTKHLVAKQDGTEIGFVAIDTIPDVDYLVLYELFVTTRLRNTGLGASLLSEIEELAIREGYEWVTLFPSPVEPGFSAERLVASYERHGYSVRPDCPSGLQKRIA